MSTNNDKTEFINNIKCWVSLDNEIAQKNEELRELRNRRFHYSDSVCGFMNSNNLQKKKIEINDGMISFYEKTDYSSLTFGYIEEQLKKFIQDPVKLAEIMTTLKINRQCKKSFDLRRVHNKVNADNFRKIADANVNDNDEQ